MDAPAGEVRARRRRGVVAVLAAAALVVAAVSLPLLALSLAVLCVLLPPRRWWTLLPALAWLGVSLAQIPAGGVLASTVVGWTVALAGAFAGLSALRPAWPATSRALAALGGSAAGVGAWLAASGGWARLDREAGEQIGGLAAAWREQVAAQAPDPAVEAALRSGAEHAAEWTVSLLPAGMALQLLLSLLLAWWVFVRFGARGERWSAPARLREFRFNDQLVWVLIAGLALLLLPAGPATARAGANLVLFMGVLYVLRGIAVFLFLAAGRGSLLLVALGVAAALLVPPVVLVPLLAAMVVGVGDTWLDIRRRVAVTSAA